MNDFIEQSEEWQRQRDAKIERRRMELENKHYEESRPVNRNRSHLPQDYKGPLSGYYDRVSAYLDKKKQKFQQSMQKNNSVPRINMKSQKILDKSHSESAASTGSRVAVVDRLIKKG